MLASIIPAVKLPRRLRFFSYGIPESIGVLKRGALVRIPWRGREIDGVVHELSADSDFSGKNLQLIIGLHPLGAIPDDLIGTIVELSEYYFTAPGTVVAALMPKMPKRRQQSVFVLDDTSAGQPASAVHSGEIRSYESADEKLAFTLDDCRRSLSDGRSAVIVAPHARDVAETAAVMRSELKQNVVEIHGGLNSGALWKSWQSLCSGRPAVVIGTRIAILAPVFNLGAVIIHESDSADHKQYDQNPRFDSRTAALMRAARAGARVIFSAHAPRVEEFALTRSRNFALSIRETARRPTSLVHVNPLATGVDEKLLSVAGLNASETALQKGKKVLIFHNRRGNAGALYCRDCRTVPRCQTCRIAERVHGANLHCHRCGAERPVPLACPQCGGVALASIGTGTRSLETALRARFPEAKIARWDAEQRDLSPDELRGADILIGTQLLLHELSESPRAPIDLGAVIATDLDDLLAHPGLRATENAWRTVRLLRHLADQSGAELHLGAIDPDDSRIKSLLLGYGEFMNAEYEERKSAAYPPFGTLIAITALAKTEDAACGKAASLIDALRETCQNAVSTRIYGPLRPSVPYRHGKWRSIAAIQTAEIRPELAEFLSILDDEYIIDRDPESII